MDKGGFSIYYIKVRLICIGIVYSTWKKSIHCTFAWLSQQLNIFFYLLVNKRQKKNVNNSYTYRAQSSCWHVHQMWIQGWSCSRRYWICFMAYPKWKPLLNMLHRKLHTQVGVWVCEYKLSSSRQWQYTQLCGSATSMVSSSCTQFCHFTHCLCIITNLKDSQEAKCSCSLAHCYARHD